MWKTAAVREYLIRPAGRADWIAVPMDDMNRVLTPGGWNAEVVPGWADHRIRVSDIEVSFSGEDVGWHLSVEGEMDPAAADALIQTVADQLATYSGEPTRWICIQE